ncbi:Asp-tRNA(Asn)/Glu-tRNA(Gln) amidotransferase GatCAB subunit C [bacterium]|nr:Asp-tRNA(Asn)/Glu-tRNA(Gln) amidotransferase GatCAB subunit C [bacterium]
MITTKEIENLAQLSRIKLTDVEKDSVMKEVTSILAYVDQIKNAPVDSSVSDVLSLASAVRNVARADMSRTLSGADRESILTEAPDREGDFIAVKKIIGG